KQGSQTRKIDCAFTAAFENRMKFQFHHADHLHFRSQFSRRNFGTTTSNDFIFIFFLTSFFNDSIHQLVAAKDRCTFFHEKWKGEDEKALRGFSLNYKGDA